MGHTPKPSANKAHEKHVEALRSALGQKDPNAVRQNLKQIASTPIEVKQMADLAAELNKHINKPNVITVALMEKIYCVSGEQLPLKERVDIQNWMLHNFDYYNETHVVADWGSTEVLLVFPPVFNGEYRAMTGSLANDVVLQNYHKDAVDGAFPKFQARATNDLREALTRSQMDEEHLEKLKKVSIRTFELMMKLRSNLPKNHPSYKAPEENDALKDKPIGSSLKPHAQEKQEMSDFMGGEDDLLD